MEESVELSTPSTPAPAPSTPERMTVRDIKNSDRSQPPKVHMPTHQAAKEEPLQGTEAMKFKESPLGDLNRGGEHKETPDAQAEELELEASKEAIKDYQKLYQEMMDGPDLHKDLMKKTLIAKFDGREFPITVEEALAGYLRRRSQSKAVVEAENAKAQAAREIQETAQLWSTFKDNPEMAMEVFQDRFGDDFIDKIVAMRQSSTKELESAIMGAGYRACIQLGLDPNDPNVERDHRVIQAMEQERARYLKGRELERENAKLRKQQEALQAKQQQASREEQLNELEKELNTQIKRFSETSLKAFDIKVNSLSLKKLHDTVYEVLVAQGTHQVTKEIVLEAAQIIREELDDQRATKEAPLPARKGMGGGVAPTHAGTDERMTIRDIARQRR